MGRRAAAGLASLRQLRRLQAVGADQQQTEQVQPQYELVVSLSDLDLSKSKLRLDAYLAARLPAASRARLQASIKQGLVAVNGRQAKPSYAVKPGDVVAASLLPPPPLEAAPEALPLEVVYEDEHLLVINKAADMVMHPSPGHYSGTLVNALLHHCQLPAMALGRGAAAPLSLEGAAAVAAAAAAAAEGGDGNGAGQQGIEQQDPQQQQGLAQQRQGLAQQQAAAAAADAAADATAEELAAAGPEQSELEEEDDDEGGGFWLLGPAGPAGTADGTVRPGIVHRLDKGTTGLLVVAKTDAAHLSLAQQFKDRTVSRSYVAICLGVPRPPAGRVATNIGRDLRDRKKMAAFAYASARGRTAASNYALLQPLAGGGAALVQWRLETGRTHQIRVHAKHIGHPLFADDTYSSLAAAGSIVGAGKPPRTAAAQAAAKALGRPALHAKTLGFLHPATGQPLQFDSELPDDLQQAIEALQGPAFV